MPFRDFILAAIFVALVPAIIARPYLGPLAWAWVGMMAPHRLTWGFAYSLPFAQMTAILTLVMLVFTRDRKAPPLTVPTTLLAIFYVWMCFTSLIALNQTGDVFTMWSKVSKIQLMLWVTMIMLSGRRQIDLLILVMVLSIGFYGVKGGVWTLVTGGGERVWGPPGSFIEGNNELALALVTVMPLMYYARSIATHRFVRLGWLAAMLCCALAVLGSHSRGAFLAIGVMSLFLGLKSSRPGLMTTMNMLGLAVLILFMPSNWSERMETITTHQDHSAQSRLETWQMIWNLVNSRPIGAGYDFWTPDIWARYAPDNWTLAYSPHSIYFQVLGEHGYLGLLLYLGIGIATWRLASRLVKMTGNDAGMQWLRTLLRCLQVSLLSFAVGGAFLNLANFDIPYYLVAIVAMLWRDCRPAPVAAHEAAPPDGTPLGTSPRQALAQTPLSHQIRRGTQELG